MASTLSVERVSEDEWPLRWLRAHRLESLGELAGGVAHDFNNLVAVILNYASFVNEEVTAEAARTGDPRWRHVRADLAQIELAAERAARLAHQLMAFARREVVIPEVVSVNDIVLELEQLLRRTIGEHIVLETSLDPDLWPTLADAGQLEQALVNLAVNARYAMPNGGTLTIESENLDADEAFLARHPELAVGRYVQLRVCDTGIGMSSEVRRRAFEPFFTRRDPGQGSGLGLATVYRMVRQAGGSVQIYSELGVGTSVTVVLPVSDLSATDPAQEGFGDSAGAETILVVEDEEALAEVTRRILVRNGYQVLVAPNGPAAIEAVTSSDRAFDLLLTDVVMPRMLGHELAHRLSELQPRLRVLYMSGYADPLLGGIRTRRRGMTLIQKPFSEAMLLAKVREVLNANA